MIRTVFIIAIVAALGAGGVAPAAAINKGSPAEYVDNSGQWPEFIGGVRLFAGLKKTGKGHTFGIENWGYGTPFAWEDNRLSSYGLGPEPKGRGVASFRVAVPRNCKMIVTLFKPNDRHHRWVFDNLNGNTTLYSWKNLPKTKAERRTKTTWKWGYKWLSGGWVWGYWKYTKQVWVQAPFRNKVSSAEFDVDCNAPYEADPDEGLPW